MEKENKYEDSYKRFASDSFAKKIKDEFETVPFFEANKSVFYTSIIFRVLLQGISYITAVAAISYFSYVFIGSLTLGLCVGLLLISIIEFNKAKIWKSVFRNAIQYRSVSSIYLLIAIICVSISLVLSFTGAPLIVSNMSPSPSLINVDSLLSSKRASEDSIRMIYADRAIQAQEKSKEVHNKMSWKGKTTRDARPMIIALETKAQHSMDTMNRVVNAYALKAMSKIEQSREENDRTIEDHSKFIGRFGFYAAITTLVIELLICLCIFWEVYYKYRAYNELELLGLIKKPSFTGVKKVKVMDVPIGKQSSSGELEFPKCIRCGREFMPATTQQRYCKLPNPEKKSCKDLAYNERRRK